MAASPGNMRGMRSAVEHLGTLNSGDELVRVVCALEPCRSGQPPEWVHVLPSGPEVTARDGRRFRISDASAVTLRSELPLLVDWEHASERGDTRAAGWIEQLDATPGRFQRSGLWGRVRWTPQGESDVRGRFYRYLSPVLVISKQDRDVQQISSVALTNCPALPLHQLEQFRAQLSVRHGPLTTSKDAPMPQTLRTLCCAALGLSDNASDEAMLAAARPLVAALRARTQPPSTPPATGREQARCSGRSKYGVDYEALKAHGFTEAQILESEREVFGSR